MLDIPIKLPHHLYQPCGYGWIAVAAAAAFALTYAHHSFTCRRNLAFSNQKRIDLTTTVGEKSTKHGSEDSEGSTV